MLKDLGNESFGTYRGVRDMREVTLRWSIWFVLAQCWGGDTLLSLNPKLTTAPLEFRS